MPQSFPRPGALIRAAWIAALLGGSVVVPILAEDIPDTAASAIPDALVVPQSYATAQQALAHEGYTLVIEGGRPESTTIRIERQGETLVKRTGLGFGLIGPTDLTGDGLTSFLLVVAPDFMAEVDLSVLDLGPEGLVERDMTDTQRDNLRERLEIGPLSQFVIPTDSASRDWDADPDKIELPEPVDLTLAYPDMSSQMAALGYSLVIDDGSVAILREQSEVWSEQSWMLSVTGPRDFTLNGLPDLLVDTARGRSFRGIALLELGAEGVNEIWSIGGHVREIRQVETALYRLMEAGKSLAQAPAANGTNNLRVLEELLRRPD